MPRTKIYVTQEDIDAGCRNSTMNCPIARAVLRAMTASPEPRVTVGGYICTWYAGYETQEKTNVSPTRAKQFIRKFDGRKPVKPFAFFLERL